MRGRLALVTLACVTVGTAWASGPSSASYRVADFAFNAGGSAPQSANSASFDVSPAAIGDALVLQGSLSSASFSVDAGHVVRYLPPGEPWLVWSDATTLAWTRDRGAIRYDVYRGPVSGLPAAEGACLAEDLEGPPFAEISRPAPGAGFFYLVTAANRLDEEGSRGRRSDGSERSAANPCP